MPKNTRAPRRRTATVDPFDLAMVTGGPLPATFGKFRAIYRVENPNMPGLLAAPGYPPLADVFLLVHGRRMTEADADAIRARWPEVKARLSMTATIATAPDPSPSNWPEGTADDFVPVARLETEEES